jgi:hypothetical protein
MLTNIIDRFYINRKTGSNLLKVRRLIHVWKAGFSNKVNSTMGGMDKRDCITKGFYFINENPLITHPTP